MRRTPLDAELVRRGLVGSREQAASVIAAGRVLVAGSVATKTATAVDAATPVRVTAAGQAEPYASRGGQKLQGALTAFAAQQPPLVVAGRRCLDAGASTGGFTDALLRADARSVLAIDVGYGQLAWSLRTDPRVSVLDRTNVRDLTPEQVGTPCQLVTADLAFISLTQVLPALRRCADSDADFVVLVKPQFEVARTEVGPGGVVRDAAVRVESVLRVARGAEALGLGARGVVASPLRGPAGNAEYFLWLSEGAPRVAVADVARAVERGPQ